MHFIAVFQTPLWYATTIAATANAASAEPPTTTNSTNEASAGPAAATNQTPVKCANPYADATALRTRAHATGKANTKRR